MSDAIQTVACIKWGTPFPADYVNRLYRGVLRHTQRPTRFICFTDDARGLDPGVDARAIPEIKLPEKGMRLGPWRKLALWSKDIGVEGDILFLDLDVVVTGGLDAFFDYKPGEFVVIRNWTTGDGVGNTSVFRYRAASAPHLVTDFEKNPIPMSFEYDNEQIYVSKAARLTMSFWPPEWCVSFKNQLQPRFPLNLVKMAQLPADARIVVFTGQPRPHEAAAGKWPAKWYKKHYKSLKPVTWLAEHWR